MLSFAQSQLHDTNMTLSGEYKIKEGATSLASDNQDTKKISNENGNSNSKTDIYSHHNYCNIGPVLGDVVTMSKDYLPPPPPEHMLLVNQKQFNEVSCTSVMNYFPFYFIMIIDIRL